MTTITDEHRKAARTFFDEHIAWHLPHNPERDLHIRDYIAHLLAEREEMARGKWRPSSEATDAVKFAAKIVRPKLGEACAQACMGPDSNRYAFIFDNPASEKYVWLKLPPLPAPPEPTTIDAGNG